MIYDYWAAHSFVLESDSRQQEIINYLLGQGKSAGFPEVPDVSARLELAAQAVGTRLKEYARAGSARQPGGYFALLRQTNNLESYFKGVQAQLQGLGLLPQLPDLGGFPAGTFTIHFTFTLKTPYLSKDDSPFQLFDNPMRKEWVFKLPYIAATQWKGALQATMVKQLVTWWQGLSKPSQQQRKQFVAQRIQLTRLFGTEIENVQHYLARCGDNKLEQWYKRYVRRFQSETGFLAGQLYFYPSFFDRLGLEVINPHDRETGAGTLPIYLEVVPAGATATFTLLYLPTGANTNQAEQNLELVLNQGIKEMMQSYGFGAKTSSGYGLATINRQSLHVQFRQQTETVVLVKPK